MKDDPALQALVESYDIPGLLKRAQATDLSPEDTEELVSALRDVLSLIDYDHACGKLPAEGFGAEYLDAVTTVERLTHTPDYPGRNAYYFTLLDLHPDAPALQKEEWLANISQNIDEGLLANPQDSTLAHERFLLLKLTAEDTGYKDATRVVTALTYVATVAETTPDYSFWLSWLHILTELLSKAPPDILPLVDNSIDDFLRISESRYRAGNLDALEFLERLGDYNFLTILPPKLKASVSFWAHEAIKEERVALQGLDRQRLKKRGNLPLNIRTSAEKTPADTLREHGILFLTIFQNLVREREVIEHAVTLTTLTWESNQNWNSLHFFLAAKALYALYLKETGEEDSCLRVFSTTKEAVDAIVRSLDLTARDNFSFTGPLLGFLEEYARVAPTEHERTTLVQERMTIAEAGVISGEGNYNTPYEHLLACQAYLSMPEAFEKTWIQLFLKLYRHTHEMYHFWRESQFVAQHESLKEFFRKIAPLYTGEDYYFYEYEKTLPKTLHELTLPELRHELDRFLQYAAEKSL